MLKTKFYIFLIAAVWIKKKTNVLSVLSPRITESLQWKVSITLWDQIIEEKTFENLSDSVDM